jgi:RNA polymerase sigma-70 factor (ECF subfamily)
MLEAAMTGVLETPPLTPAPARSEDRRLASGCAAGDSQVFEEVYRLHGPRMKSIAFGYLGNVPDAEDAVQETFLKIHRAAGEYSGEASFGTWAIRILVNTCIDLLRKRKRRGEETPIDDEIPRLDRSSRAGDPTRRLALARLLAELPEQRRSVFTLFEIEGLSHAEIGEVLGISEGNSKWILFATKKQLQEMWTRTVRKDQ